MDNELKSTGKDSLEEGLNVSHISDTKQITRFDVDQSNQWFKTDSGMADTIEGFKNTNMADIIEGFPS